MGFKSSYSAGRIASDTEEGKRSLILRYDEQILGLIANIDRLKSLGDVGTDYEVDQRKKNIARREEHLEHLKELRHKVLLELEQCRDTAVVK